MLREFISFKIFKCHACLYLLFRTIYIVNIFIHWPSNSFPRKIFLSLKTWYRACYCSSAGLFQTVRMRASSLGPCLHCLPYMGPVRVCLIQIQCDICHILYYCVSIYLYFCVVRTLYFAEIYCYI